jgi:hypothetical protein
MRLTREENDLLCRVEGDAPMGGIMRSHWLPVCLAGCGGRRPFAHGSLGRILLYLEILKIVLVF